MTTFQIGSGAEKPSVAYGFTVDDAAANLTGYGSVTFRMRPVDGTAWTVNRAGTVTADTAGSVRYDWQPGDTTTPGDYAAHFTVHFATGDLTSPEFAVRVFPTAPQSAAHREVRRLVDDQAADLFTDQDVEDALARNAHVLLDEPVYPVPQTRSGTVEWKVYPTGYAWLDDAVALYTPSGTAVAGWSLDAGPGRITFAASTGGSVLMLSGSAHEPALAAADLADQLVARYSRQYDFTSDGADFKRSQLVASWSALAAKLRGSATRPATVRVLRTDTPYEAEDD